MKKLIHSALVAGVLALNQLWCPAALNITVGDRAVPAGSNVFQVPISVTGGDFVTDMAGAIQIGDGGPLVGGKSGPKITAISYAGSIWTNAAGGFTNNATVTLPAEVYDPNLYLNIAGQKVTANGLLFTLTIDATGFSPGVYDLKLAGVGPAASPFNTQFQNAGANVPVTIANGHLYLGTNAPVVAPQLQIARTNGNQIRLSFFGQSGQNYRIQWAANLSTNWGEIPVNFTGAGTLLSWVDDGTLTGSAPALAPRRFYRVRLAN